MFTGTPRNVNLTALTKKKLHARIHIITGNLGSDVGVICLWMKVQVMICQTNRIRYGLMFNDSVIMAPTVNCRIESGSFTINSPDKALIIEIYNTLK